MKRPEKKVHLDWDCGTKHCIVCEDRGYNQCHDLDTKYIEELKEKIEILMKRLDDDFRKPSVEEIQYVLMKYLPYKKHETQVAKAIDRLNKEG